jgi:hypothetical protein
VRADDAGCPVCRGIVPCNGGGNLGCYKRDPVPHYIALVLDSHGGARTVVADWNSLMANVGSSEWAHVVPNVIVHTPIAWNDIPIVIARAKLEFDKWLDTRPNLEENLFQAVSLYRLRQLRHSNSQGSIDLNAVVWA